MTRFAFAFKLGLLTYLLLEIVSIVLVEGFGFASLPGFRQMTVINPYPKNADIDTTFGVWHLPGVSFHHTASCFDVYNHYNTYGARDAPRELQSSQCRLMMIGDSFVEGFGVDSSQRISNLLEQSLSREVLNMGTSGNFGTTQMSLLYHKYGPLFDHDILLVGLFPHNDFDDDSYLFGQQNYAHRYRPYRIKDGGRYRTVYFQDSLHHSTWFPANITNPHQPQQAIKRLIKYYSYLYRLLAYIWDQAIQRQAEPPKPKPSRYQVFSADELDLLMYNLSTIDSLADELGTGVLVFTIPTLQDVTQLKDTTIGNQLGPALADFCASRGMEYLDLAPYLASEATPESWFLPCDPHWSIKGNEVVADILWHHLHKWQPGCAGL